MSFSSSPPLPAPPSPTAAGVSASGVRLAEVRQPADLFGAGTGLHDLKERAAEHLDAAMRGIQALITAYQAGQGNSRNEIINRSVHSWLDGSDEQGPAGGLLAIYRTLINSLDGKEGMNQAMFSGMFMIGKLNDYYQFVAHHDPNITHATPDAAKYIALTGDQKKEYQQFLLNYFQVLIEHGAAQNAGAAGSIEDAVDYVGDLIRNPEAALQDPLHAVKLLTYLKGVVETLDPETTIDNIAANASEDPVGTFTWLLNKYDGLINMLPAPIRDKFKATIKMGPFLILGIIVPFIDTLHLIIRYAVPIVCGILFAIGIGMDLVHFFKHRNHAPQGNVALRQQPGAQAV